MTKTPILEKLTKILRLANNKAATEGEVQAAMARAKEIAMQHNIDISSLDLSEQETARRIKVEKGEVNTSTTREHSYHRFINHIVKEVFGVFIVRIARINAVSFAFIGDANDVAVAKEIFAWLEKQFPALLRQEAKTGRLLNNAADRNGYYRGLTEGILEVNRRSIAETLKKSGTDSQKYAMVVRSKETAIQAAIPEFFPHLRKGSARNIAHNESARSLGREQGRKMNLNQVGGASARPQIS